MHITNKSLFFTLIALIVVPVSLEAQEVPVDINSRELPANAGTMIHSIPFADYVDSSKAGNTDDGNLLPEEDRKEVMQKVAGIYRVHLKAMEAQLDGDPVSAEKFIVRALNMLQNILNKYPEVQASNRFSEVYRTVMTEYRKFYGIDRSEGEVRGDIFAIQKEMFSEEEDWMDGTYKVPENLPYRSTEVNLPQNDKVNRYLTYFSEKRHNVMRNWLQMSEKYFPMMKRIFREEGVPVELINLSMIESGLNPKARSWASAVGIWQFIRTTAPVYGLDVNWWVDERRDPEKATRAAARHLSDLHDVWGDWHLALAGYNISPRGLKYAIKRAGGEKDYWAASPYLPKETRNYVPSFIAATMIKMNPETFGFKKDYGTSHYNFETYQVESLMSLEVLADAAGISVEKLKEYNPELLRWATPPGDSYELKLPNGTLKLFAANYKKIHEDERSHDVVKHTVNKWETQGVIASKYGTSVHALYETNKDLSSTIYPGQKIIVTIAGTSGNQVASRRSTQKTTKKADDITSKKKTQKKESSSESSKIQYKVRGGDTIGHIAEWFDVGASQIRRWNNTGNTIRPGQFLTIYVPQTKRSFYESVSKMSHNKKQELVRKKKAGVDVAASYMATNSSSGGAYIVQSNDTLLGIANRLD